MTVRELALTLLDEYESSGKYVNLSLSSHLADKLSGADRSFLTALLYTAVEHKITYDYYVSSLAGRSINEIDIHTLNILRLGLCQLLDMSSLPDFAAVNETVSLARHKGEAAFVNGLLRAVARAREKGELPMPKREKNAARYLSVAYSFPQWMAKHFISLYGEEETEALFKAFNKESSTDLTVNTLKLSREELLRLFEEKGIAAVASPYSHITVRLPGSVNPRMLPGFDEGYFFVQDTACAISAEALGAEPGDSIIDVCACPGGKSFAAAIFSKDEGRILSLDIHESKLSLIESGAERMGFKSITVGVRDATAPDEGLFGSFDRVICDVPCSGLGVLGKKPDMRYRDASALSELPKLQYSILDSSSAYLRDGGTLIYSTCTLNPAENEEIAEKFLLSHPDFSSCDFTSGELRSSCGMLTLLPHKYGIDGFFIAKFKKESRK